MTVSPIARIFSVPLLSIRQYTCGVGQQDHDISFTETTTKKYRRYENVNSKKKRDTNRTERITSDECKEKKQNVGELPRLKIPVLGCGSWMWVYTWRGIFPQMDM